MRSKRMKRIAVLLTAFVLAPLVGCGGESDSEESSASSTPASTETVVGSKDSFGDGTYEVGTDIAAGSYQVKIQKECTLKVDEGNGDIDVGDGAFSGDTEISMSADSSGAQYDIKRGTPVFEFKKGWTVSSSGCGTWTLKT